jgi:nucleotide-binding universal stress UspA family protein
MAEIRTPVPNAVVVAVDGSEASRAALRWAAGLGAPLRAVRAWSYPTSLPLPWSKFAPQTPEELDREVTTELEELVRRELPGDRDVAAWALRGDPAAALVTHVAETSPRLLVVGSRGLGGFKGLLLGSVSRECLEYATCPVVVVPGPERAKAPTKVSRILVGLDGSDQSSRALDLAVELARTLGADVMVVHAFDPGFAELPPDVATELRASVESTLQDRCGEALAQDVVTDYHVMDGDPRQVLVRCAAEHRADLIVIGAVGTGTVNKELGPVAAYLGTRALVPVAVVR